MTSAKPPRPFTLYCFEVQTPKFRQGKKLLYKQPKKIEDANPQMDWESRLPTDLPREHERRMAWSTQEAHMICRDQH